MTVKTAAEVAEEFRCSRRKITDAASKFGIGADLGGRAGFRFTEAETLALWEAMRVKSDVPVRRRRRRA